MEDWRIGGLRWGNDIVLLGLVFVEKNGVVRKVPKVGTQEVGMLLVSN